MEMQLKRPAKARQWLDIYRLYRRAFPRSERKPFSIIVKMQRQGKSDVWCLEKEGKTVGFAATINADDLVLLDYLAVDAACRGQGLGTAAMKLLLSRYAGRGLFVEIESPYEDGPDRTAREKRKRFYEGCGLQPLNVMAEVFGVKMELLGSGCEMDFARYQGFYRDNYSPWAAEHIREEPHPEAKK